MRVFENIKKRDERITEFDSSKITSAILRAGQATGEFEEREAKKQTLRVLTLANEMQFSHSPCVEKIQDVVERTLLDSPFYKTAKAYILYREQHNQIRNITTKSNVDLVEHYIQKLDWKVKENSNMCYSLQGLNNYISSDITSEYWLNRIYPPEIRHAHKNGDLHIHDLSQLSIYCVGWDLQDLLKQGFKGVAGKIESAPPKHFRSALGQIVNFFYTLAGEAAGAQALSNFDTLLAPFVRLDCLNYTEVKQAMQEFVFNINVPTRVGFQSPFVNITMDLYVPSILKDSPVVIGGEECDAVYSEFQPELDMINKAFAEVMMEGDAKGRVFSLHPEEKVIIYDKNKEKIIIDSISSIIDKELSKEGVSDVSALNYDALSFNTDTFKTEFKPITQFVKHSETNTCVKVVTHVGNEVVVTKGHSLFVFTSEGEAKHKPVKDMRPGDFILSAKTFQTDRLKKNIQLPLQKIKGSKYNNSFSNYIELSPSLLWLFGFFAGNGNMLYSNTDAAYKGVELSSKNENVLQEVKKNIETVFPDIHYTEGEHGIVLTSYTISRLFCDFFSGNVQATTKYVPEEAMNSVHFESFIKGYFTADGNKETLKIRTVSKRMSKTLPVLFAYKGYKTYVRNYTYESRNTVYQLDFSKDESVKNVFPLWKYIKDNLIKKNNWQVKEFNGYKRDNLSLEKIKALYQELKEKSASENFELQDDLLEKIINGDLFLERIISIEDFAYSGYVYDFSVEGNESFIGANSIVFHNTFPIPTYNITKNFDWVNPNLDMIWKMTGKYGIPYFSNFVNSDMSPEDARSMCCRLRLDNRELIKRGGGLFGSSPLTGSVGVVTINLPRLGYLAKNENDFLSLLKEKTLIAANSLAIKRKVIENFTNKNLYPYSKFYLRKIKQSSGLYWKNHFSTIGIIGMNEACLNFIGKNIASEAGQQFSCKVMDFMRTELSEIQETTGCLFNLEATPAEGTSYRLATKDKKKFPKIICANENEYQEGKTPYYTNSTHLPVNYTDDILETLMLQDKLQTKYTGGTVLHIFLGEQVSDIETIKNIIKKVSSNFKLPYFTITPTFSICPSHGYLGGEQKRCPVCNHETEIYSRVVGYLRPVTQWNDGKQSEFSMRKTFKMA